MGLPVDNWSLDIGNAPGNTNYFSSGTLDPAILSIDATGIPTDGRPVYVRLQYLFGTEWKFVDYTYTAIDIVPQLLTPIPGTTLSGSSVTFTWDSMGGLIDDWTLYVGSSLGAADLFNSGSLGSGATLVDVTGLPTDGRELYVRLRYGLNAVWASIDFVYTAADLAPELLTPIPGSVLPGSSASFTWTANGAPVQTWILEVGSSPGLSNYFYSGSLAGNVVAATATGIPTDSRPIYVRLRYLLSGAWTSLSYEYVAADLVPEMSAPVPGSVLPSGSVTFTWASGGSSVTNWTLGVGTQVGLSNIFYSGTLASMVSSANVTGLPLDSSTIYVRLRYLSFGAWSTLDYVYTASAPPPVMTAPAPGSQLTGPTATFQWNANGNAATEWQLVVGSTAGANDLYDSGMLGAGASSHEASGLPVDGSPLFVRLLYRVSGALSYADFAYTAALQEPALTTPVPGSVLNGPDQTFAWSANGAAVTAWRVLVGSGVGLSDFGASGPLAPTTLTYAVSNLPTDGSNVHVRLEYDLVGGASDFKDYVYISGVGLPELLAPTPGSVFTGPDVMFSWTSNDAPVVWWLLYVGTSPGSSNLHYSGYIAPGVISREVTGLPTDSRTIYVRLRYLLDGRWTSLDYQYTAAELTPALVAPAPGSVLPGADVTFQWSSNGAPVTKWILDVGTSQGSSNLHYSGYLAPTVLSRAVTGLPTDGSTVYVRLRYLVSGAWKNAIYPYTTAGP